ncbi:biotin--[acetyl-CoA-carboxylase] ligase [Moraxella sp. Tifton1]|uniref:biotin--[acetyl-CoA-carboxylase] ligase n=1 Tax=Moraxella oculi TaxID=2940516 RepID=UPI002012257E|nr:biotin--[acetyl-CoA-carboxylase] ligase [Moraxella sp. Tifton1]MCL1623031.1 biotin--[acetyl-CoA-carboxylase] ligase [Moraxella sp. Tifton1]
MHEFNTPLTHTHFDETDSTNTQLILAVSTGKLEHSSPHLYTADHQTAGRGQHGRTWVSGMGNVFLSLYIPIGQGKYELNTLSGLLSLAVGFELANLPVIHSINQHRQTNNLPTIGVKWANDIGFYDEKLKSFKKLAGILIEPVFKRLDKNTLVGVVIGVGLNVTHSPTIKDGLYQATCLKELSDINISAEKLYTPMAKALFQAIKICNRCQESLYLNRFIDKFNTAHILTGKIVRIFIQNNMNDINAQGKCVGIGHQGELLLSDDDGVQAIFAGMAKVAD